jgi:glycosyltransferase involved in cell wall biosynthesis
VSDGEQLAVLPKGVEYVKIHKPTSIVEPLTALKLNRERFDVVFSPMQTIGSFGKRFKLILTVHDLIYFSHPKPPAEFNFLIRLVWRLYHLSFIPQKLLLSGADQVVTVSETSKAQIVSKKLTKRPVNVVPNAANQLEARDCTVERKLVYMGSFMPYKNVDQLIRGTARLNDYKLVLLSRIDKSQRSQFQELATKLGVEIEFLNGVSDEEYTRQLCSATALVHASSDEGFGIPIIEAMSVGCPVVCSDIPIFREIAGEAGLFFQLGDYDDFARQLMTASENRALLKKRLLSQADSFNWQNSAEILKSLLS